MKRKLLLTNALMGLMILFAILFQSFHSFEHLVKQFSEKKCHHIYNADKTEFTHSHNGLEKCFVCEFALSSSIKVETLKIALEHNSSYYKPSFLSTFESISFYNGSSFSLRGPPIV